MPKKMQALPTGCNQQSTKEMRLFLRIYRTYSARFSMSFFSWLAHFSGKADVSLSWFSQWSFTSKRFHQKIPTGSKVMAVSKGGTSGAIYFLSPWFQRVLMRSQPFPGYIWPKFKSNQVKKGKAISEDKSQA